MGEICVGGCTSMKKTNKNKVIKIIRTIPIIFIGIIMIIPLLWMLSASFKYESEIFSMPIQWIPNEWNFSNYSKVWNDFTYAKWYFNTIKVTVLSVIFCLTSSSLAGYAFAKLDFKGKNMLLLVFVATIMIPVQVRLVPQYLIFRAIGLYDTHLAVSLPWIFNGFAIFLLRQFYMGIPNELSEAARIDGCNEFQIFYRIIFPLTKSALMALVIIIFTWSWNNYLSPLVYIGSMDKQMLSVGISMFAEEFSQNYGIQMAGASLGLIPIVIVYLIGQKQFIQGIALTGTKG